MQGNKYPGSPLQSYMRSLGWRDIPRVTFQSEGKGDLYRCYAFKKLWQNYQFVSRDEISWIYLGATEDRLHSVNSPGKLLEV